MFKLNIIIITLSYVFGVSVGLPHVLGQCDPDILAMPNFDVRRFVGLWYSIEMFPTYRWYGRVEASCSQINLKSQDNVLEVVNTQVHHKMLETIEGTAVITSTDGSAKFALTIPDPGTNTTKTIDIWVLDTDYTSYALVYSCNNEMLNTMLVGSWKLSRTTQLPQWAIVAIDTVIAYTGINPVFFEPVDQSAEGCFYYPFLRPGVPVLMPGRCDYLIEHQEINFSQFQGKWYEIHSYPHERSTGQCISHVFTAASNSEMNLVSSRVIDQHLVTTNAVVSSIAAAGILSLTIPTGETNPITSLIWILETDYSSYALAYSCANRDSETKIVMSWQLSRTPMLPFNAQSALNSAIANTDDLDQRYYKSVNQSDEACFYLPDVQPGEPVIFPGQCDSGIMAVQNFNLFSFLGHWTLIASYGLYEGTCVGITFSLNDDGLIVVAINEVRNQHLVTRTGSAVISSIDGSGRLMFAFPGTEPSEYLILGTDYMTYALIYSCENISNNQRIISSWQLSRTKALPVVSSFAINQIINSIDVLDNRYFFHMDQSDDACFYYPPPGNTLVVFPGQCDLAIPVVANFDVRAYMGRWYNIEAYPTSYQTGTCSKADYSINNEFMYIENSQIVDQVLESWIGFGAITSFDDAAKFEVTFSINGEKVSAPYWVLATDYISYALVYSCINLDAETRAVYSAKLSRTEVLSSVASTVMDAVISTIPVLHPVYYVPISHAEEDCMHYTHYDENGVLLNGQCSDESLTPTMAFFNPYLFIGDWYEIARYPSSIQQGVCVSSSMLLGPIVGWEVTHSTVRDQEQKTNIIPATIPTDGRGVISAHINGVPFNNIFILATDYREYALAYSCRNVDSHTKQIYSWKLSRSRSGLSALANSAIEYIVNLHPDLWKGYYQNTRQDDEACLLYPDVDQNPQNVELPGRCPDNIRGVPNFDTRAYMGRWYETARYPTPEQLGQCSRVEYNLIFQLDVTKTEVVQETLRTQTGYVGIANDGSGLMNVVLYGDGDVRESTQYILATDYTSYSLVYSCTNLDNGNRRVTSWKLSRTPTLSSEAFAAMSSVIAATPGLREEYYQSTSQSDQACFYTQG